TDSTAPGGSVARCLYTVGTGNGCGGPPGKLTTYDSARNTTIARMDTTRPAAPKRRCDAAHAHAASIASARLTSCVQRAGIRNRRNPGRCASAPNGLQPYDPDAASPADGPSASTAATTPSRMKNRQRPS